MTALMEQKSSRSAKNFTRNIVLGLRGLRVIEGGIYTHTNESIHQYCFRHTKGLAKLSSASTIYQLKHRLACLYEKYSTRG